MKKTHQWMLFFLFLFFAFTLTACTKNTEKLVFYQTKETKDTMVFERDTERLQENLRENSQGSLQENLQESAQGSSQEDLQENLQEDSQKCLQTSEAQTRTVGTIAVYLCGQVCNPGVYILEEGSRLYQAVEMAGGLTSQAQAEAVNLARVLSDSEQIYIPDVSETVVSSVAASTQAEQSENEAAHSNVSDGLDFSAEAGNSININQATVSELMQLPGIGQVKAEAIVAYRNSNGLFSSIEEIKNVPGIKEAAFEKIKGMITVF